MESKCFDGITSTFAQTNSRRGAIRMLGAAVLSIGGVGLLGLQESDAKRKGKKKKKGKKNQNQNPTPTDDDQNGTTPLPTGALCERDSQCNAQQNQICEVPQNASNSDTRCCGATGAVCGGVNEDGDFIGPLCCIGEAGVRSFVCSQSDPNNPFVQGTCIPAPDDL